jgi:hypothetical protein
MWSMMSDGTEDAKEDAGLRTVADGTESEDERGRR